MVEREPLGARLQRRSDKRECQGPLAIGYEWEPSVDQPISVPTGTESSVWR
jgi:hypothetical protein